MVSCSVIALPGQNLGKEGHLFISNDHLGKPRFFVSSSGKVGVNLGSVSTSLPVFDADVQMGSTAEKVDVFISGTLAISDVASQTEPNVIYYNTSSGLLTYGAGGGGGGAADAVNLSTATANADYRVLLVDESGLTNETIYVDSNDGLTFNPSLNYLQSKGEVIAYYASDRRLKDNITPISNPLEKLAKINGYEFDWNENQQVYKGHDVGVIAQEIEEILPELVTTRDNGDKAVKYEKLAAFLISVVKEQQKQIDELKSKL